jgi:hypothetical protein
LLSKGEESTYRWARKNWVRIAAQNHCREWNGPTNLWGEDTSSSITVKKGTIEASWIPVVGK